MLNISESTRQALKSDNVPKQWCLHFVNGETADITNQHISSNSLTFTEAICSGYSLQFGLCEDSAFECDCICPVNVTGATVEVSVTVNNEAIKIGRFKVVECVSSDKVENMVRLKCMTSFAGGNLGFSFTPTKLLDAARVEEQGSITLTDFDIDMLSQENAISYSHSTEKVYGEGIGGRTRIASNGIYELYVEFSYVPCIEFNGLLCIRPAFDDSFVEQYKSCIEEFKTRAGAYPNLERATIDFFRAIGHSIRQLLSHGM